jgi:hypothetical protein
VSDPKKRAPEPDDDMLEFLGGIDEVNDESSDDGFLDFLAKNDIEKARDKPPTKTPAPPAEQRK